LKNPGFENELENWITSAGTAVFTADEDVVHAGVHSGKGVEIKEGSLGRLYQDMTGIVAVGGQYKISGWIKTQDVTGRVVIALDYVASNGWTPANGYIREIGHVAGTQDWTHYESGVFIIPLMPSDVSRIWFLLDFNAGKGTAWWDDLSLIEISSPPASEKPDKPEQLTGPTSITILLSKDQSELAEFSASATDPNGDRICVLFDWGDGTSFVSEYVESGVTVIASHQWSYFDVVSQGSAFEVKAKAIDTYCEASEWTDSQTVCVSITGESSGGLGEIAKFSGYYAYCLPVGGERKVTSVSAIITVPEVTGLGLGHGTWIGVGGNPLLQAGVLETPLGITTMYEAFYEDYPAGPVKLGGEYPVYAGDEIVVNIMRLEDGKWTVTLKNLAEHGTKCPWSWSLTKYWEYPPDQSCAGWVQELKLPIWASFNDVAFSDVRVSINGEEYRLDASGMWLSRYVYNEDSELQFDVSPISGYDSFTINHIEEPSSPSAVVLNLQSACNISLWDEQGRHTGYNAATGTVDLQIPGSIFCANEATQYIVIVQPNGTYTINLTGIDSGDYHLHFVALSNGSIIQDQWLNGIISPNETLTSLLNVTTFSDGTMESGMIPPLIPEFPSFFILIIFIIATPLLAMVYRRKHYIRNPIDSSTNRKN